MSGLRKSKKKDPISAIFLQLDLNSFVFSLLANTSVFSVNILIPPSIPHSLLLFFPAVACLWLQAASETWPRAFNH